MMWTRRNVLRTSATIAAGAALLPRRMWSHTPRPSGTLSLDTQARDPALRTLAARALDVARQSGASYADVRITMELTRDFPNTTYSDMVTHAIGVRALVNGYWGFASTPYVGETEVVRVARDAVALAQGLARRGVPRDASLVPVDVVKDGDWTTPVVIDPMNVAVEEVVGWMDAVVMAGERVMHKRRGSRWKIRLDQPSVSLRRGDVVCASTEGGYLVQTVYRTELNGPYFRATLPDDADPVGILVDADYFLTDRFSDRVPTTNGWERALKRPVDDMMEACVEQLEHDLALPVKPIEVGRYDMVCDWSVMGSLTSSTLGVATQLDRAIGDEANATGTSYLGPNPTEFLGTRVASPKVTLSGDRSAEGALGTLRWDAEGVPTAPFPIVKDGMLVGYQTTRESAAWLAAHGGGSAAPRSYGCAGAQGDSALDIPLQHSPNFVLAPGTTPATFESLVSGVTKGLVIRNGGVGQVDQQATNGFMSGYVYEVVRGRIVARIANAGVLFRSSELWNNITTLGDTKSSRWLDVRSIKGEPEQVARHSVSAPPAHIKELTVIDISRRG